MPSRRWIARGLTASRASIGGMSDDAHVIEVPMTTGRMWIDLRQAAAIRQIEDIDPRQQTAVSVAQLLIGATLVTVPENAVHLLERWKAAHR